MRSITTIHTELGPGTRLDIREGSSSSSSSLAGCRFRALAPGRAEELILINDLISLFESPG